MAGKNQIAQFKETYEVDSTFVGGTKNPDEIGIVGLPEDHPLYIKGLDVALADWNEDLWDAARLSLALSDPIDPAKFLANVEAGVSIPPTKIVKRNGLILAFDGRRKTLAGRGANRILIKRGETVDGLIAIPVIVDKSTDVEMGVRLANEGHLIEPPYVKAANAARLRNRGRSDEAILAVYPIEPNTLQNWLAYVRLLDPAIKAQVEQGPKADRLPFAVGVELAKWTDPGEDQPVGSKQFKAQGLALDYLRKTNAKLTGEKGRENAKAVIRAVMAGTLEQDAPPVSTATDDGPPSEPTPAPGNTAGPVPNPAPAPSGPNSHNAPGGRSSSAGGNTGPQVTTQVPKLSWPAMREIAAHLEPSESDPHVTEGDRMAHAVFQVITGADPTAEGLAAWPRVQGKFRKVVRSGAAPAVTQAPKTTKAPPPEKPAAFQSPHLDAIRSIQCPVPTCDKGVDKRKRGTCSTCEGYGKISPARAEKLKLTRKPG